MNLLLKKGEHCSFIYIYCVYYNLRRDNYSTEAIRTIIFTFNKCNLTAIKRRTSKLSISCNMWKTGAIRTTCIVK